jgi:EpsI family protein
VWCNFRLALTTFLLVGTGLFINSHYHHEIVPAHLPLESVPFHLGGWSGTDEPISNEIVQTLGDGDFLARTYRSDSVPSSVVQLFMAYFPTQRTGDTIHSPLNCLPGSGWFPLDARRITLSVPGHRPFPVNRYYVAKGSDRALVFYWYWAHNRGVASEYWAKFYLVADSIRLNRSDGALIRITTTVDSRENPASADQSLTAFGEKLVPLIDKYVPR